MQPNPNLNHHDLSNITPGKRLPWRFCQRLFKVSKDIFDISRRFNAAAWEIDRAVHIFLILKPTSLEPQIALGEVLIQRQNLLDAIDELDTILADASNAVPQDLESDKDSPIKRGAVA